MLFFFLLFLGLAETVLFVKGVEIVLCQKRIFTTTWDDRSGTMHDRQECRSEVEETSFVRNFDT